MEFFEGCRVFCAGKRSGLNHCTIHFSGLKTAIIFSCTSSKTEVHEPRYVGLILKKGRVPLTVEFWDNVPVFNPYARERTLFLWRSSILMEGTPTCASLLEITAAPTDVLDRCTSWYCLVLVHLCVRERTLFYFTCVSLHSRSDRHVR